MENRADNEIEDDVEIESSPLSRKLKRDGNEVDVLIYRIEGRDEGWTLEVVDEQDASTVWDEPFDTDQAALDAVMRIVEAEGISVFLRPLDDGLH